MRKKIKVNFSLGNFSALSVQDGSWRPTRSPFRSKSPVAVMAVGGVVCARLETRDYAMPVVTVLVHSLGPHHISTRNNWGA